MQDLKVIPKVGQCVRSPKPRVDPHWAAPPPQVESYVADNGADASLNLGGSMMFIRAAFDVFKRLMRTGGFKAGGGAAPGTPGAAGKGGGGGGEEGVCGRLGPFAFACGL